MEASAGAGQPVKPTVPLSVVSRFLNSYATYLRTVVGLEFHELVTSDDTTELLNWIVHRGPRPAAKRGTYVISSAEDPDVPVIYVGKTFSACGVRHRVRLHLTAGAHSPPGKPVLDLPSPKFGEANPWPLAGSSLVQRVFPVAVERDDVVGIRACRAVLEGRIRIDTFCCEGPRGEHAAALLERGALLVAHCCGGRLPPLNQRLSWLTQGPACGRREHQISEAETLRLQHAERSFIAGFCAGLGAANPRARLS